MRPRTWLLASLIPLALSLSLLGAADDKKSDDTGITWKKTVLDKRFRAEGVAVADVNKDGKMDVLAGDVWYEAPDWKVHAIRPGKEDYRQGDQNVYSNTFACWTEDLNGDGWTDLIVVGFPGAPCHWYENPQGKDGHWKQHEIWHSACNETPAYVDLLGTGKRVLLMGWQPKGKNNEGQMAYFTPGSDPTKLWEMHPVSEPSAKGREVPGTQRFSHGLGAGDVNGDGKLDVLCTAGWWEQPAKLDGKPWKFHAAKLGDACADMFATDLDGDGKPDILSSSAHKYGIWSYLQRPGKDDSPAFVKQDLFPMLVSQTHAMHFVDINGDGLKDLVTGKRWWAHGPKGDADPNAPPKLYWFEAKKSSDGLIRFVPHEIDEDSGIGTQFTVTDINGDKLLDVVTANKKGVFVFEQVRGKK
ncbi:MAG TPA: VCBS repeat-containing protein [Gemmataceae bacterium]|jgi:hypothetical protein